MNNKNNPLLPWAALFSGMVALAPLSDGHAITMRDAVNHPLKNNPEALSAQANQEAVAKTIEQAESGYLPVVDLSLGLGRETVNSPTTRATKDNNLTMGRADSGLSVTQMLFDGNSVKSSVEKAKQQHHSATLTYQKTALQVAMNTAHVYLEALKQEELSQMIKDNVLLHQKMLEMVRTKSTAGAGNDTDVQQTESRLALVSSNHVMVQTTLLNQRTRFERMVDLPAKDLNRPGAPANLLPASMDAAVDAAIKKHPAIQAAQAEISVMKAELKGSEASLLPRVDFEVAANNNDNSGGTSGSNRSLSGMLWLKYNLFRGGADSARMSETTKRVNQVMENHDQIQRSVVEETKLAWNAFQSSKERVNHLKKHVSFSKSVTEAYHDQFKMGKRTLLDVLNSENELYAARSSLASEQYGYLQNYYKLLASMGILTEVVGSTELDTKTSEAEPFFQVADSAAPTSRIDRLQDKATTPAVAPQDTSVMVAMAETQEQKNDASIAPALLLNRVASGNVSGELVALQQPDLAVKELSKDLITSLGLTFAAIPKGCFQMGMSESEKAALKSDQAYPSLYQNAEQRHELCVPEFEMAKHEVTVEQFRSFVQSTGYVTDAEQENGCQVLLNDDTWGRKPGTSWKSPGFGQQDNHPVVCISWNDANAFVQWINSTSPGYQYRLPTEGEWEYAARSATQTTRYWGDNPDQACLYANIGDNPYWQGAHACQDGYQYTAPIGRFKPNSFGLYDMLGNAREWTCSSYQPTYGETEKQCATASDATLQRVDRGGSWYSYPEDARVAGRDSLTQKDRDNQLGFRLVRQQQIHSSLAK